MYNAIILIFLAGISILSRTGLKPEDGQGSLPGRHDRPSSVTRLTLWHTMDPYESVTLRSIIRNFHQRNPKIRINVVHFPYIDAKIIYLRASFGGSAPDIFRSEISWTPLFVKRDYLKPIERYLPRQELDDYLKAPLRYCRFGGHLWGLPQATDCLALLYNRRILTRYRIPVPKSMKDLYTAAVKLTDRKRGQYGFFIPPNGYFIQSFVRAFGGGTISDERKILINTPGSLAGLKFCLRLRRDSMPERFNQFSWYREMTQGFACGKYAMIIQGPWAIPDIMRGIEFGTNRSNLGIAVIPRGPAGYASPAGGHNWVISRGSRHTAAAVRVIRFLNKPENQILFARKHFIFPTRQSAYSMPELKNNAIIQQFRKQLALASNRPRIPESGEIYRDFSKYMQLCFNGRLTPQKALSEIEQAWKKLLLRGQTR